MILLAIPGLDKMSQEFRQKLVAMADRLQLDPSHIASVMKFESNFKPDARNQYSNASGLIQWMPSTAAQYGTTVEAIRAMSAEQQLDLVEQYFSRYKGKLSRIQDVYFAVFCPNLIGRPLDTVVGRKGDTNASPCGSTFDRVYTQNSGFDYQGKKGYFTASDVASPVTSIYRQAGGVVLEVGAAVSSMKFLVLGALLGGYVAWRRYRLGHGRRVPL